MAEKRTPPEGMAPIIPHLVCKGAADAIEFYRKAFDAVEQMRVPAPDGRLMHAMIHVNGAPVFLADEFPEYGSRGPATLGGTPVTIHLYSSDADAFVARAEQAGARVIMPVQEMFWGDRYGIVQDPFGHHWSVATHVRDVSMEELQEAVRAMHGGQG